MRSVSDAHTGLFTPGSTHINGTVDTALHASALQHQPSFLPQRLLDILRHTLWTDPTCNLDSPHPRHQPLRHLQPILIQISNHQRRCAGRMRREQADHTNWSSTTNHQRISESQPSSLNTCERHRQRLEQRAFFESHTVWQFVQPCSRVSVITSQRAVHRRRGEEYHVWTAVVLTRTAGRTGGLRAWDAVFESYSITWKQKSSLAAV